MDTASKISKLLNRKKHDFLTPQSRNRFLLEKLDISVENKAETPPKQLNFSRFKVKNSVIFKKASSLSPIHKNSEPILVKDNKFDYRKMKIVKEIAQESEIKLLHLYNLLRENQEDQGVFTGNKARICLEMIDSVFIFNEKTTREFKEIIGILENSIFCNENYEKNINQVLGESHRMKGEEYRVVLMKFLGKLKEIQRKDQEEIKEKNHIIEKINQNLLEKQKEIEKFEKNMKEYEENISLKYQKEMIQQQEKIAIIEAELKKQKIENFNVKCGFEQKALELENNVELIRLKTKAETRQILQEKEDILLVKESEIKGFENLKLLYGKLSINHKTLCATSKFLKEKFDHCESQLSDLMNENQSLKIRAGIAWDEMTPRPSFDQFKDFLKLDDVYFKNKSTKTLVNELSGLVICKSLNKKGNCDKLRKGMTISRQSSRNHDSPMKSSIKMKNNVKITVCDIEDRQNTNEGLQTPPIKLASLNKNFFLQPSLNDLDSISSIGDDNKKMSSNRFSDDIIEKNENNNKNLNNNKIGARKVDRSKTIQPRKSAILSPGGFPGLLAEK